MHLVPAVHGGGLCSGVSVTCRTRLFLSRVYLPHMEMHPRFDQYDAIFGDDPSSYVEFLDALEATLSKSKLNLIEAAAAEDWNVISATRHSLKPTMTLLGAEPINELLHEWRPSMSALDVSPLESALDQVLAAVKEKRNSLG